MGQKHATVNTPSGLMKFFSEYWPLIRKLVYSTLYTLSLRREVGFFNTLHCIGLFSIKGKVLKKIKKKINELGVVNIESKC